MSEWEFVRHDGARSRLFQRDLELRFLKEKGTPYIKAWYLHHVLDYTTKILTDVLGERVQSIWDVLTPKALRKNIGPEDDPDLRDVLDFVEENSDGMIMDCGKGSR